MCDKWTRFRYSEAAGFYQCAVGSIYLVHSLNVPHQVALRLVGDARAVGARMVAQLHVHRINVLRQTALRPEGDTLAAGTLVVPALLVHRLDVCLQVALGLEGDAGAVGGTRESQRDIAPLLTSRAPRVRGYRARSATGSRRGSAGRGARACAVWPRDPSLSPSTRVARACELDRERMAKTLSSVVISLDP